MARVLIVDDEKSVRMPLQAFLEDDKHEVVSIESAQAALELLMHEAFDIVLTDILMPKMSGFELIKQLRLIHPDTIVITMTGHGGVDTAAEAVRLGAFDYLIKPLTRDVIRRVVKQATNLKQVQSEIRQLEQENREYQIQLEELVQQRERDLQESRQKYHAIMETIQEGYYEVDLSGKFLYANQSLADMLEISLEEIRETDHTGYLQQDSQDILTREFRNVYKTGKPRQNLELNFYSAVNEKKYCQLSVSLMRNQEGRPTGFNGIVMDVTMQKQAELDLHHSRRRYKDLVENSSIGILYVDTEGNITFVNPRILKILGSPSAEATKQINVFTFPPLVNAGISQAIQLAIETGEPSQNECFYESKWGAAVHLRYALTPIKDADGNVIGIQGAGEDVTEQKQIEAALKSSERKFKQLFNKLPDAVFLCEIGEGRSGNILDANNAAGQQTGYTIRELKKMNIIHDISTSKNGVLKTEEYEKMLSSGKTIRFKERKKKKDGAGYVTESLIRAIDIDGRKIALSVNRQIFEE